MTLTCPWPPVDHFMFDEDLNDGLQNWNGRHIKVRGGSKINDVLQRGLYRKTFQVRDGESPLLEGEHKGHLGSALHIASVFIII